MVVQSSTASGSQAQRDPISPLLVAPNTLLIMTVGTTVLLVTIFLLNYGYDKHTNQHNDQCNNETTNGVDDCNDDHNTSQDYNPESRK